MLQEKNSLWIKVLRSKYGEYNGKVREGHFMKGSKGWSGGTWGGVTKVRGQSHWFASKIKWLVGVTNHSLKIHLVSVVVGPPL